MAALCSFCLLSLTAAIAFAQSMPVALAIFILFASFVFANFVEYSVHRWPMHSLYKPLKTLYKAHSGDHHRYFTHEAMEVETKDDYTFATTNAKSVATLFGAILIPTTILIGFVLGLNIASWFYIGSMAYYMLYETTHLTSHLKDDHLLLKIPYFRKAKARHRTHHNTRLMRECNFNVSFPLFDRVFGTLK